jgi:hypothetical protein
VDVIELEEAMHDADLAGRVVVDDERHPLGLEEPEAAALAVAICGDLAVVDVS